VRRDMLAAGAAAAELLLEELGARDKGQDVSPREVLLPTEFVARPSCAPAHQGS
jgi:DNA-binding LacI/PurR family transcriptional regulator